MPGERIENLLLLRLTAALQFSAAAVALLSPPLPPPPPLLLLMLLLPLYHLLLPPLSLLLWLLLSWLPRLPQISSLYEVKPMFFESWLLFLWLPLPFAAYLGTVQRPHTSCRHGRHSQWCRGVLGISGRRGPTWVGW